MADVPLEPAKIDASVETLTIDLTGDKDKGSSRCPGDDRPGDRLHGKVGAQYPAPPAVDPVARGARADLAEARVSRSAGPGSRGRSSSPPRERRRLDPLLLDRRAGAPGVGGRGDDQEPPPAPLAAEAPHRDRLLVRVLDGSDRQELLARDGEALMSRRGERRVRAVRGRASSVRTRSRSEALGQQLEPSQKPALGLRGGIAVRLDPRAEHEHGVRAGPGPPDETLREPAAERREGHGQP